MATTSVRAGMHPPSAAPRPLRRDAPSVPERGFGTRSGKGDRRGSAARGRGSAAAALQPASAAAALADLSLGGGLFGAVAQADRLVAEQLAGLTPLSFAIVLGAGLLTSLSPCTLSVLPLTIGYIGGYAASEGTPATGLAARAGAFALGLATTLAALGVASSLLGGAYGQIGGGLPIAVSLVAILMGLNLLEVLPLRLPSVDVDIRGLGLPPAAQAYLAGLTFALAASPCSTPILATLLAYVSTSRDPLTGGALLFAYALGYVAPLLAAALFTGALKDILAVRRWSGWVPQASGALLLSGGVYGLLSRVVPG